MACSKRRWRGPRATVFGKDAYPDLDSKAAALLHSVARNHALIDGDKRLALTAIIALYGVNGRRLTLTNDAAYDRVIAVAAGELDSVDEIAAMLRPAPASRRREAVMRASGIARPAVGSVSVR